MTFHGNVWALPLGTPVESIMGTDDDDRLIAVDDDHVIVAEPLARDVTLHLDDDSDDA